MTTPRVPALSPTLPVAYANIEKGGLHLPGGAPAVLEALLVDVPAPPALLVVCEGRGWDGHTDTITGWLDHRWGAGPRYKLLIGHLDRADLPPVLAYDTARMDLLRWDSPDSTRSRDCWNRARFDTDLLDAPLTVLPQHWHPWDRAARVSAAHIASGLLGGERYAMVVGDLNSKGSGPMYPEPDWTARSAYERHHKAWQPAGPGTAWVAHTDPVDHFIGTWDPATGARLGGLGWHSAAVTDWHQRGARLDTPMVQTTNAGVDRGGGTVIDDALLSPALAPLLVPGSYRVHLPALDLPRVSDHRLLTFALGTGAR